MYRQQVSASASYLSHIVTIYIFPGEKSITSLSFYCLPLANWADPLESISSQRLQGNEEGEQVFAKPETKGRMKCPSPVVPCPKVNLSEALVPILNTINNPVTLGQGTHHILPASYFEKRREMLNKLPKYQDVAWESADTRYRCHDLLCYYTIVII